MIHIQRVSDTGAISEVITLDATLDVNIANAMIVTAFPVEDGADISDHAQKQPVTVTMRSLVSATPLRIFSLGALSGDARPRGAFEILTELQNSKELVRIVTDLATYDNMVLLSFDTPRRQDTKNALLFTAVFREIRLVSSQIVQLPPEEDVEQTATSKEEGGKVTPAPTQSESESAKASLLYRTLQGVGVIE
jgi:hypothetical protein